MIIGIVGLISSGKGTVGDMLVEQDFKHESFASSLKDATAKIFNWDRELVEGITNQSRIWREAEDKWWGERLGIPNFTPRLALQLIGTEVFRNHWHQDIWILTMENRIKDATHNIVITDARFPNEVQMIRRLGGKIVRVKRDEDPEWWNLAVTDAEQMPVLFPDVHSSEYSWAETTPDYLITNNGTVSELQNVVNDLLKDLLVPTQS